MTPRHTAEKGVALPRLVVALIAAALALAAVLATWQPPAAALHDATVTLSDHTAGAESVTATVTFTTTEAVTGESRAISIRLEHFDLDSSVVFAEGSVVVDGQSHGNPLSVGCGDTCDFVAFALTDDLPAGAVVEVTIPGATNPAVPGARDVRIQTRSAGEVVEETVVPVNIEGPLTIATETLPNGAVGEPYSVSLEAVGGTAPYTWSIGDGALPDGLTLDPGSGEISGEPEGVTEASFTALVTDAEDATESVALGITVVELERVTVTIQFAGPEHARVTSDPAGIDCHSLTGGTCEAEFAIPEGETGARVEFEAVPDEPPLHIRWEQEGRPGVSTGTSYIRLFDADAVITVTLSTPLVIADAAIALSDPTAGAEGVTLLAQFTLSGGNPEERIVGIDLYLPREFALAGVDEADVAFTVDGQSIAQFHAGVFDAEDEDDRDHLVSVRWEPGGTVESFTAVVAIAGVTNPATAGEYAAYLEVEQRTNFAEADLTVTVVEPSDPSAPIQPSALVLPPVSQDDGGDDALAEPCALTPTPSGPGAHLAMTDGACPLDGIEEIAPGARSLWVTAHGAYVGYIVGAGAFVNADFVALFPDGAIPAGTVVLVVR